MGHIEIDLGPALDPDTASPIGAMLRLIPTSARRSRIEGGAVCFAAEEPIFVQFVERQVRGLSRTPFSFWRLEVKVPLGLAGAPQAGDHLIATEHPYGNRWIKSSAFKPPSHAGNDARALVVKSVDTIDTELESLKHDPWETGKYLTAGLSVALQDPLEKSVSRSYGKLANFVFGVCANHELFRDTLSSSEPAQKLLHATRTGQLRVGPRSVGTVPIHERARDDAAIVMFAAASQTLAGPGPSEEPQIPTEKLLAFIYRDHLYNLTRRHLREDRRHTSYREGPEESD